jgi:hypothetical protein
MLDGAPITVNGDGETTRDFCYVANVVQANLLAATTADPAAVGQVYNVAVGGRMSLNELYGTLRDVLIERHPALQVPNPVYEDFRAGDVRHSQADVTKARRLLGYAPTHDARAGLAETMPWYERRVARAGGAPTGRCARPGVAYGASAGFAGDGTCHRASGGVAGESRKLVMLHFTALLARGRRAAAVRRRGVAQLMYMSSIPCSRLTTISCRDRDLDANVELLPCW